MSARSTAPLPPLRVRPPGRARWWLWAALVVLLVVAQSMLVWLTLDYEDTRAQERADSAAAAAAAEVRRQTLRSLQSLQALMWALPGQEGAGAGDLAFATDLLRQRREVLRVELRDNALRALRAQDSPFEGRPFGNIGRGELEGEMQAACASARRSAAASFSRSYFVPQADGLGQEVMDLCIPRTVAGAPAGYLVATLSLGGVLEAAMQAVGERAHELSLVEADGTRLVRAGSQRGLSVYQATRLVDLPGQWLQLRADSVQGRPGLIPNLATALVLGLSLGLLAVVLLLARDMRRRARAESGLAQALAFRRAMEDSLVTGLRARDEQGRITYVNPAFCAMVGWDAAELIASEVPPYWPPEQVDEYRRRQAERLSGVVDDDASRQGFETLFIRRNGERFPVMIYEAPLRDGDGQRKGWMSAVVDVSTERRMEELSRQQQERLQATARLATVGEMASLVSHELNQPLAAIASYATGSLNLIDDASPDPALMAMLRQAIVRIAEQAERAGRVIKSVHGFVRRREQAREAIGTDQLIDAVLPLVRLQARKSGTRIELQCPKPAPRVLADRTMVEQVLLNLTRNAVQAMESDTPLADRVLTLRVNQLHPRWVQISVRDAGAGIAPEVASRLFTPFFTTRPEGMGLGLSLCRTVIEQHGGALDFGPPEGDPRGRGTEFRFTLPVPEPMTAVPRQSATP